MSWSTPNRHYRRGGLRTPLHKPSPEALYEPLSNERTHPRVNVRNLTTIAAAAATAFGMMLLASPDAEASVSAECWAHLADVEKSDTPAADRRYHLERGQASPCTEQDAADNGQRQSQPQQRQDQGSNNRSDYEDSSDDSSRYCRKHWYC